jgi:hypothetical protein
MTTNAGNSNLLGASGNVPGHYPKGNISFHDLVNHSIFEGKIFVFDPGFLEELHPVNVSVRQQRSLFENSSTPRHVVVQLQGELSQSFGRVPGMKFCPPRPRMEKEGCSGSSAAAVGRQHEGNGGAFNISGNMYFDRILSRSDQTV